MGETDDPLAASINSGNILSGLTKFLQSAWNSGILDQAGLAKALGSSRDDLTNIKGIANALKQNDQAGAGFQTTPDVKTAAGAVGQDQHLPKDQRSGCCLTEAELLRVTDHG